MNSFLVLLAYLAAGLANGSPYLSPGYQLAYTGNGIRKAQALPTFCSHMAKF
jgi:hypothetical protein